MDQGTLNLPCICHALSHPSDHQLLSLGAIVLQVLVIYFALFYLVQMVQLPPKHIIKFY